MYTRYVLSKNKENYQNFSTENFHALQLWKNLNYYIGMFFFTMDSRLVRRHHLKDNKFIKKLSHGINGVYSEKRKTRKNQ